jgi:hypothetical protein
MIKWESGVLVNKLHITQHTMNRYMLAVHGNRQ